MDSNSGSSAEGSTGRPVEGEARARGDLRRSATASNRGEISSRRRSGSSRKGAWPKTRLGMAVLAASALLAACGSSEEPADPQTCASPEPVAASEPITRFGVHFVAGDAHLLMNQETTAANGATFKAYKARMYLSQLALIREGGERVQAELVDDAGNLLPYGVALVDLARPESMNLHLRAPAGSYAGLAVSIGVPEKCASGAMLNHSDASEMLPPLDVDSDMYWSWDPGYTFLKFEGEVLDDGQWQSFFFHTGEEQRFVTLELVAPFEIPANGGNGPSLVADFNRLLVASDGSARPDITDEAQRRVHSGEHADSLAENMRASNFLRLSQQESH